MHLKSPRQRTVLSQEHKELLKGVKRRGIDWDKLRKELDYQLRKDTKPIIRYLTKYIS